MKPPYTVAEFMARARESGHDALALANDPEAAVVFANLRRDDFLRRRDREALVAWREQVGDVSSGGPSDPVVRRWLAVEYVRLEYAAARWALGDATVPGEADAWTQAMTAEDRADIVQRFELDLNAPLMSEASEVTEV